MERTCLIHVIRARFSIPGGVLCLSGLLKRMRQMRLGHSDSSLSTFIFGILLSLRAHPRHDEKRCVGEAMRNAYG
jgi:hypothetical protein